MDKKLFKRLVESIGQMDEIVRGVRTPSREFHVAAGSRVGMSTDASLTSKGQATIPKAIRDALRVKAGDTISFTLMPDGVVVMRAKNKPVSKLGGLLFKKSRKRVPIEKLSR